MNSDPAIKFGPALVRRREAKGLNQSQLAERLGKSSAVVSAWETKRSFPDGVNLIAIAEALDTTVNQPLIDAGLQTPGPDEIATASALLPALPDWFFEIYRDMENIRGIKPVDRRECLELAVRLARIRQKKPLGAVAYRHIIAALAEWEQTLRGTEDPPSPTAAALTPGADPPAAMRTKRAAG